MLVIAIYAGIYGILAMLLALNVTRCRVKNKISMGDGGHPGMQQAMRAYGNFMETVPFALILIIYCQSVMFNISPMLLHWLCGGLLAARILHIWGMLRSRKATWPRVLGMVGTVIVILAASGILLWVGLSTDLG